MSGSVSLKKYLYKIIYNSSLDLLKHEKVKEKHIYFIREVLPDEEATAFEMLDLKQLSATIDEAITELPQQMRKIFELSRYEGLKNKTIAIQLNIANLYAGFRFYSGIQKTILVPVQVRTVREFLHSPGFLQEVLTVLLFLPLATKAKYCRAIVLKMILPFLLL